jgi:hypothetical protein
MKRFVLFTLIGILVAAIIGLGWAVYHAQRADYGWNPQVPVPMFESAHPRVVIDEAHNNASTAGWASRYWPLARLLRRDGYDVRRGTDLFTEHALEGVEILIIANASGAPKPQFMGINLPVKTDRRREDPAFTEAEIGVVRRWVEAGGTLLLIADHAPFGAASAAMAAAFGVTMYQGFVEVPGELSDPLLFSDTNSRLGRHPIITGRDEKTAIHRVMTFTGQSLDGPPEAAVLLALPDSAVEYISQGDSLVPHRAGKAQGLALEVGQGRVVVLGEAGMLTAQVANGEPFGMNLPDNDNRQFALNVMHWLSRRL